MSRIDRASFLLTFLSAFLLYLFGILSFFGVFGGVFGSLAHANSSLATAQNLHSEPQIDARDFLRYYASELEHIHTEIIKRSMSREFLRFRGYGLIDYATYKSMATCQIAAITKPLVFFRGTLAGKPIYSELGGVSIDARAQGEDGKSRLIHLQFQGRYFSDLLTLHAHKSSFYALCVPTPLRHCLLLGIGERW